MPSIVVIGASGYIGSAVVKAAATIAGATVTAVVRDPAADKSKALVTADNIKLAAGSMADGASLDAPIAGADAVFVNVPGAIDRAKHAINAIEATKRAGTKHVVIVSVSTAGGKDLFGRQFAEIEDAARAAGIPFTLLRLPFFHDNIWGSAGSIKGQSKIYNSIDPDAVGVAISTADAGEAAKAIFEQGPGKHAGRTYHINSAPFSQRALAAVFSEKLGRTVEYVQVPEEGVVAALKGFGMEQWQADGIVELNRLVSAGAYTWPSDFDAIVGRPATTVEQYVSAIAGSGAF